MSGLTLIQKMEARSKVYEKIQDRINQWATTDTIQAEVLAKTAAEAVHASYPQYEGAFDALVLCRINRDVKTKAGLAFKRGDYAIRSDHPVSVLDTTVTVYSVRNSMLTAVKLSDVEGIL